MKLYAYKIGATNVSQLTVWSNIAVSAFVLSDTIPSGYDDITSIENLDNYWSQTAIDYKKIRNEIKVLVGSIGWASLNLAEKNIAAKWFVVDKASRDEIHDFQTQLINGENFHRCSVESRINRFNYASTQVINRLSVLEAKTISSSMLNDNLVQKYINLGIEGTLEGDPEGLFDFIETRAGTSYEFTGFTSLAYSPYGYVDMSAFSSYLIDVLKNGNY